jgi:hypothetical protein
VVGLSSASNCAPLLRSRSPLLFAPPELVEGGVWTDPSSRLIGWFTGAPCALPRLRLGVQSAESGDRLSVQAHGPTVKWVAPLESVTRSLTVLFPPEERPGRWSVVVPVPAVPTIVGIATGRAWSSTEAIDGAERLVEAGARWVEERRG